MENEGKKGGARRARGREEGGRDERLENDQPVVLLGFSIGLDWQHQKETRSPLHEYEKVRSSKRKHSSELEPLSEEVRQKIIAAAGAELKEIEEENLFIRSSRTTVGCDCGGKNSCATNSCVCTAHGIACSQDACDCADDTCKNPLRDKFESEKVDRLRKQKLQEANQELQSGANSSPLQNLGSYVKSGVAKTLNFLSGSNSSLSSSSASNHSGSV